MIFLLLNKKIQQDLDFIQKYKFNTICIFFLQILHEYMWSSK